ncbi:MFS transporter [Sphingosinicella microcystinivorans]|uniref:MFS transporter n=1 Tax=Sphingosinicella microcystinivorans TaxID=335406 RepID=UPI0022F3872D|nr:MFS transporter [Sphingosinicella microcystinivorans]WBX85758.1 MFS transporter [Sphingosinicella microcystinivorans]
MPDTLDDPSATRPFAVPIYRTVWIASMVSNFGGMIQSVGASWMMTTLTTSPALVALVQSSVTLPIMLLSLAAGAIADNRDRRLVMLTAQGFMLAVSVGLAVCTWAGLITPWLLLTFTFLIGCGTALNGPAWQASVGDMVPRAALPGAVAYNSMNFNTARSLGPAIGGAIVAAAGAAAAFAVNAVSYIGLITVLARWRPERPPQTLPREGLVDGMSAGIRYVAMSPTLRAVLMRAAVFGMAASAVPALMPIVARHLISGSAFTYGLLLGAFGVGAIGGALSSGRLRRTRSSEWIVRIAIAVISAGTLVTAFSPAMPLTMIGLFLAGGGWVLALSTFNVTVQMSAPRWVVARALALYQMWAFGGMAIGSWVFGELAGIADVRTSLMVSAALLLLGLLIGRARPLPEVTDLDLDPIARWTEPEVAVPVEPRTGPVVVTIEYRIPEASIRTFLTVMSERRRIRIRDGARHWTLLRDLGDPELWVERYHVPTWLDYIRHNQRRTNADADNTHRLRALHKGEAPPRVHRMVERQTGVPPDLRLPSARELAGPLTDPSQTG